MERDQILEPNDSRAQAQPVPRDDSPESQALVSENGQVLILCPHNEDWFSVPVQAGGTLTVTLSKATVDTSEGDERLVRLVVYGPDGMEPCVE